MSTFVFVYRAPKDYVPGAGDTTSAWQAWFESLGASVTDIGNPVLERTTLGERVTDTVLGGYSMIEAPDLAAAVELAKGCPMLSQNGAVEVGEVTLLNPETMVTTAEDHARATGIAS